MLSMQGNPCSEAIITKIRKGIFAKDLVQNKWLYIMFLLPFIWNIIFNYIPMGGIVIAFQRYNVFMGVKNSPWVGMENFKQFFEDPFFFRLIRNTIVLNVYGLLYGFPIPIIIALVFNEIKNKLFKKITQTISYLPYFISVVVICSMTVQFLSPSTGVVNVILEKLGIEGVYFFQKAEYFRTILISMGIWQSSGFLAIIYMAALSGIETEQYEAAKIDGANRRQQLWHITLPGLIPTIIIMLLINLGSLLSADYQRIILIYNPAIYDTSDVLNTYVYRQGIQGIRYSYAQAVSLFQNVIGFILLYVSNKISAKLNGTTLW